MGPRMAEVLLHAQTDEALTRLAATGHERAFALLVERYRRPLLRFAAHAGPHARAEDVVQQTLLAAWLALNTGAEVVHVRGWLHQIARNAAAKIAHDDGPQRDGLAGLPAPHTTERIVDERLALDRIVDAVRSLPEAQRVALVHVAVDGRSGRDVARTLGVSEGAVRQLVRRGRQTVRAGGSDVPPSDLGATPVSGVLTPLPAGLRGGP
jgi:RNA polymerase sigma-70 factor (ECF subfamily)